MNTIMGKLMEKLDIDINGKVRYKHYILLYVYYKSHNMLTYRVAKMEAKK